MSKKLRDNFNVRCKIPIDTRFSVQSLNDIDRPYEGLLSYQITNKSLNIFKDGIFQDLFKDINDTITLLESKVSNDTVNVVELGAVGDGITDNTTIIQNIINQYAGNKKILIPYGIFIVGNINLPSNTYLIINGTLKLKTNTNNQLIGLNNVSNIVIDGNNMGVLDGNGTNQNGTFELACIYSGTDSTNNNIHIKNIHIKNAKNWNINMSGTNCSIIDSIISDCPNMSFFTKGSNNCVWRNCVSYNISNDYSLGFYGGVTNSIIDGCIAYNNTTNGLASIAVINDSGQPTANSNIVVSNCIAYNNNASGFAVWGVGGYESCISFYNCIAYGNNKQNLPNCGGFLVIRAQNVIIENCESHDNGIGNNGACGIYFTDVFSLNIGGNNIYNEGQGSTLGFGILGNGTNVNIHDNLIFDNQSTHTMTKGIQIQAGSANVDINSNSIDSIAQPLYLVAPSEIRSVKNNGGHNPISWITSPTIPTSGTYYTNNTPYTYMVNIYGGTVTTLIIDNKNVGLSSGQFFLPPKASIRIDYSVAPNWLWYGM